MEFERLSLLRFCLPMALGAMVGLASLAPSTAQSASGLAVSGVAALSDIAKTIEIYSIDSLNVASPLDVAPLSSAAEPPDATSAETASLWRLRRVGPSGDETQQVVLVPRQRPVPQQAEKRPTRAPVKKVDKTPPTIASIAAGYRHFRADLQTIAKLRLDQPKNIRRAQSILMGHNQQSLAHGWIAMGSEIAAQSNDFKRGLEKAANSSGGKDRLISGFEQKPDTVLRIDGWPDASREVMQIIAEDTALMRSIANRLTEIAYGRNEAEAGLAQAATNGNLVTVSLMQVPPSSTISARNWLHGRARNIMAQMLALGAHAHLSENGTQLENPTTLLLASNSDNNRCLRWAQLNFKQCLAAARGNEERAYCLAKHGIEERAACWSWIVGTGE